MPYFIEHVERQLTGLTVDAVNRAARKYLQTADFAPVMITDDAAAVRERLTSGRPAAIQYSAAAAEDVRMADKAIARLPLQPASVRVVPVAEAFEGRAARR